MTDYSSASAPWYSYKTSITSVVVGNSVTTIGDWAFYNLPSLTTVTLGKSVTSIGEGAFYNCVSLTTCSIPNSVTTIGECAFDTCGLTSVDLGSVTTIEYGAFQACDSLTSVAIGKSVTTIGSNAFRNCDNLATVYNASDLTLTKGSTDNGYIAYYATNIYNKDSLMYIAELDGSPIQVASAVRDENGKKIASTYATKTQLTDGSVTKVGTATVGSTSKPIYLNAGSPAALSATVGSATQPVYLNGGTVTKCTYTLGASVPSGAVFTDTKCTAVGNHYSPTKSTTKSASGGTSVDITGNATNVITGIEMDAKGHVTGVVSSALKSTNTTYTVNNAKITITQGGTEKGSFTLNQSGAQTIALTDNNTTYSTATTSANGLMSSSDKSKLDGITASADSVSFTRNLTSGTKVGTITINGTGTDLYCQTNTDTHYASKNVVGSSTATSNTTSALTNGNVYLNSVENGAVTSTHKISGSGATTVTTDASGNIVISSTDTNTNTDTKNTTGSTNSTSKLFLVGATSQAANPVTYSNSSVYETNGALNATSLTLSGALTAKGNTVLGDAAADTCKITGATTITGDLTVSGNITQSGTTYITDAQEVHTTNDYIKMRDGATGGLASGAYSGLEFVKYDGTNNGRLVVDNTGTARVGDSGSEQPLLTRSESSAMTDGQILTWDGTNLKAVTSGYTIKTSVPANAKFTDTNTDTKVAQTLNESSTSSYAMLYSPYLNNNTGSSGTTSVYRTNKVYVQPSSGTLTATKFIGNVTGNCSGSSGSCTGNSATATKLTTGTTGSATTPVYFNDGKPIACSYELTNIGRPSTWED